MLLGLCPSLMLFLLQLLVILIVKVGFCRALLERFLIAVVLEFAGEHG